MSTENIVSFPRFAGPAAEDAELLAGLRIGASPSVERLISLYRPRLYAVALRFTRNHHDAEDIVQEVFLRAVRAAPRFRGDSTLATWLYAIATNLSRNHHRNSLRRRRDVTISLDTPAESETQQALALATGDSSSVTGETELRDLTVQIEAGLARLSVRDRRILHLRDVEHADYQQIATTLGLAMGTVKSRISRARERLRAFVFPRLDGRPASLRYAS